MQTSSQSNLLAEMTTRSRSDVQLSHSMISASDSVSKESLLQCSRAGRQPAGPPQRSLEDDEPPSLVPKVGLFLGPGLALLAIGVLGLIKPDGLTPPAQRLAGMTLWMATWWCTDAVPIGATALLPIALFPPLGIESSKGVAPNYVSKIIWLFFGGVQLSFALERCGLHRRIAFGIMRCVGMRPHCLLGGFMLAVGLLSMFLSNTSTTVMVMPMAMGVLTSFEGDEEMLDTFGKALMLGVAYAASVGGMGSLIGTGTNGVLAQVAENFNLKITFSGWLIFAAPLSLLLLLLFWVYLVFMFRVPRALLPAEHPARMALSEDLGRFTQAEAVVAFIFAVTAVAWMIREPVCKAIGWDDSRLDDGTIAMIVTLCLFVVPARFADGEVRKLLDWATLVKTPWSIFFLLGGGFALANAYGVTGLSAWMGTQLEGLGALPTPLLVLVVVLLMTFLTEFTSNVATSTILLPIFGNLACAIDMAPAQLMIPGCLAASCAFMLPMATPPNAIVFSSGLLQIKDMAKTGFFLNIGSGVLITVWMLTVGAVMFDTSEEDVSTFCSSNNNTSIVLFVSRIAV